MDTRKVTKLILIARVSNQDQRDALPAQELRLRRYAKEQRLPSVYYAFDESAFKGERRKFSELVKRIEKEREYCAVVFDTVDRFTRNSVQVASARLIEMAQKGKIELHFVTQNLIYTDQSGSYDELMLDMNIMFAKQYSVAVSTNVKRKFEQLRHDKQWNHRPKLGYLRVDTEEEIIVDESRRRHIVKMFELRKTGLSCDVIAEQLYDDGFRSSGGQKLYGKYIDKLLKDPFYYGEMRVKGVIMPHRYEPIISRALFNKCQEVNQERGHRPTKSKSVTYTLSRIPKCARCHRSISSYLGRKQIYLRCSGSGPSSCGNRNCPEALLLPGIIEDLSYCQIPKEFITQVIKTLKSRHDDEQAYFTDAVSATRREFDDIKRKLNMLYDDRLEGRITAQRYDELATRMESRQQELNDKLKGLTASNKQFLVSESYLLDLCERAVDLFQRSKSELKQELLSWMLSNVELNNQKLSYDLKSPFNEIVTANKKGPKEPNDGTWLGRMGVVQTFEADPLELEQDITVIRQLLDESAGNEEEQKC